MKKLYLLFMLSVSIIQEGYAQYNRYIIQLRDKNESPFTLGNPSAYLSFKAIDRRTRQKISIDSTDLPVSPAYLESIRAVPNVTILNKSNWLNHVCIQTTDANALARINAFPFVKASLPVAARFRSARISEKMDDYANSSARIHRTAIATENAYNYGNTFNQVHIHKGEYLHNLGFTGAGVTIAILDAGFWGYRSNPAFDSVRLQNRVLGEWDFVANERSVNEDHIHGMYCFSIMAANRPGLLVGSAPGAGFYLFRTEDVSSEYPVEEQNWAAAAELADSLGADMISSSLGYTDFDDHSFDHTYAQRDGRTSVITRAANLAAKKGMIVMNSAGNSGNNSNDQKYVACPADGDSVVAVGAVDANGNIAGFSSWGPNGAGKLKPNIVSLGQGTAIAGTDGNPASDNGTSLSNPNMAGLIASLWQAFPEFTNMEIIDAVQRSAHKFNNPDSRFGFGIPDFKKAFALLVTKGFNGTMTNDHCVTTLGWSGKSNSSMKYEIERKAGFEEVYTTITSVNTNSTAFSSGSYTYKDTLNYAAGTSIDYRIKQILPGDTVIVLMNVALNTADICNTSNSILVHPSPFKDKITVTGNTTEAFPALNISIYNMKGQRLYYDENPVRAGMFSINIPTINLPAGVYVLTVRNNGKILLSKKIMK